jgi:DNA-binding NarL/FixJ family response regulator
MFMGSFLSLFARIVAQGHPLIVLDSLEILETQKRRGTCTLPNMQALHEYDRTYHMKKRIWEFGMSNLADLTARELEILQLVIAGKTNKAIANEMYISEKTVEFHLGNIYEKIGARTRLMAGVWALRHGLEGETGGIPR